MIEGEDSITAIRREFFEEIGIKIAKESIKLLGTKINKDWLTDTYILRKDVSLSDLKLQPEEVIDAKWVTIDEFNIMCMKGLIVPIIVEEFKHYKNEIFYGGF